MHALIPSLFILIALNGKQLKNDALYRANVFALVGISYFFLLQYVFYWNRIFPSSAWAQYLPTIAIVLSTVAIALSPWNRKSHPVKTGILCTTFALLVGLAFTFDKDIKEYLAEAGGYFRSDNNVPAHQPLTSRSVATLPFVGIELDIPDEWRQEQLPSGHQFITQYEGDRRILEIRPNCLGPLDIDTPTYIQNVLSLFEANRPQVQHDTKCVIAATGKQCLVRVLYPSSDEIEERWHWTQIARGELSSVSLDILIFDREAPTITDVWWLISSVKTFPIAEERDCRTPAAWL